MKNVLRDLIPARHRKVVYALVVLAGIVVAAWQTADGDWKVALGALIASATSALAGGNVTPSSGGDGS